YFNRAGHSAVWTGTQLILWGGSCVYAYPGPSPPPPDPCAGVNPAVGMVVDYTTGTSFNTTSTNAPYPALGRSTVWTGREMIIWGGLFNGTPLNQGYGYDPVANAWRQISTSNAPSPRSGHSGVWADGEMIVWGGGTNTGGRYHPDTDSWGL